MTLFIIGFGCVGARDVSVVWWGDADLFRMRRAVGCMPRRAFGRGGISDREVAVGCVFGRIGKSGAHDVTES